MSTRRCRCLDNITLTLCVLYLYCPANTRPASLHRRRPINKCKFLRGCDIELGYDLYCPAGALGSPREPFRVTEGLKKRGALSQPLHPASVRLDGTILPCQGFTLFCPNQADAVPMKTSRMWWGTILEIWHEMESHWGYLVV